MVKKTASRFRKEKQLTSFSKNNLSTKRTHSNLYTFDDIFTIKGKNKKQHVVVKELSKKQIAAIKELPDNFLNHKRRIKILSKKQTKKLRLYNLEVTKYKVKIKQGKLKGRYRQIEVKKIKPPKSFYGCEKIITDRKDIFYIKYKTRQQRANVIKTLYRHYDFNSFKVVGMDINAYRDTYFIDNEYAKTKSGRKAVKFYQKHIFDAFK